MRRFLAWCGSLSLIGLGVFALSSPAQAQDTESFSDPGPVDLSDSDHATGNVGSRITVGSLDLGSGAWNITASVRLFVPDPDPSANDGRGQWKNSQGCGLYAGDTQLGGADGSSSLWSSTADGKEVVFTTFLVPPDWVDEPIVLPVDHSATVRLECFIDQSHGGATLEQRDGMVATDISIEATQTLSASPTPSETPSEPECVDVNEADAEELAMLKHVDDDIAAQIIALRPFSSVDDLDRVNGLAAGGPKLAELVAGDEENLPMCEIATDDGGSGGNLAQTGFPAVTFGLIGAGLVGLGVLGYVVARRRNPVETE